jgi:hypothetical protein
MTRQTQHEHPMPSNQEYKDRWTQHEMVSDTLTIGIRQWIKIGKYIKKKERKKKKSVNHRMQTKKLKSLLAQWCLLYFTAFMHCK